MESELPQRIFKTEELAEMPVALVAGGAGFIGSRLCEALLSQNLAVFCVDNFQTGKYENIAAFKTHANFRFLEYDLNFPLPADCPNPTYIFHLAGAEENKDPGQGSLDSLTVNAYGTKNLLDLAVKCQAKFLLASSADVYQGVMSNKSLTSYSAPAEPAAQGTHQYAFHEAKRFAETILSEYVKKFGLRAVVVRVADVYGPGMRITDQSMIAALLRKALRGESMELPGDGLQELHPTFITDLIYGLSKAMFRQETDGKIFSLLGTEKVTTVSLAHLLNELSGQNLEIKFSNGQGIKASPYLGADIEKSQEELGWRENTFVREGMTQTLAFFGAQVPTTTEAPAEKRPIEQAPVSTAISKTEPVPVKISTETTPEKPGKRTPPTPRWRFPRSILLGLIVLAGSIFIPFSAMIGNTLVGGAALLVARNRLEQGKMTEAAAAIELAENRFAGSRELWRSLMWFPDLVGQKTSADNFYRLLDIAEKGSGAGLSLTRAGADLLTMEKQVFASADNSAPPDLAANFSRIGLQLGMAADRLAFVQAEKDLVRFPAFFPGQQYLTVLPQIQQALVFGQQFLPLTPDLLAVNGRKKYLVLLQNNAELRPSGGFLGSFAVLTLENGRMLDYQIKDIYAADGQLRGKITPPDEILHFLGQPSWFMRDSNWSPDFALSAKRAAWFLEKETGEKVDGVIGIDLFFVQKLLAAVGPVKLDDYNETVSAADFFNRTEYHAEINFFPGSTQKKDYLSSVAQALWVKLSGNREKNFQLLAQAAYEALAEKHLQIYLQNPRAEEILAQNNWTGKLVFPEGADNGLGIVEANLGANKANYFVKRKINIVTELNKGGDAASTVTVNYENNSATDTWPAGRYKNYLRFYVPRTAQNISLDIGDSRLATISSKLDETILKKLPKDRFLVYQSSESGLLAFGTLVEIPIHSQKTVTFRYSLPQAVSYKNDKVAYRFYVRKQAGTDNDPLSLKINFPAFLVPADLPSPDLPSPLVGQERISYNTNLSRDREFNLLWKKQF